MSKTQAQIDSEKHLNQLRMMRVDCIHDRRALDWCASTIEAQAAEIKRLRTHLKIAEERQQGPLLDID